MLFVNGGYVPNKVKLILLTASINEHAVGAQLAEPATLGKAVPLASRLVQKGLHHPVAP